MIIDLFEIASKTFEVLGSLQEADLIKRERISRYFKSIGEKLHEVAEALEAEKYPHEELAALKELAVGLADVIGEEIDNDKARELSQFLKQAIQNDLKDSEVGIQNIKKCAGQFDALATKIECTPKSSNSKPLLLSALGTIGIVAIGVSWFLSRSPVGEATSPEILLGQYATSLSERDFETVKEIFPKIDEDQSIEWLQGVKSKKSPIDFIQVVGSSERTPDSSENAVTLRAKMRYCREDRSGSTDVKNYTFIKKERQWHMTSRTAPENVKPIQC